MHDTLRIVLIVLGGAFLGYALARVDLMVRGFRLDDEVMPLGLVLIVSFVSCAVAYGLT